MNAEGGSRLQATLRFANRRLQSYNLPSQQQKNSRMQTPTIIVNHFDFWPGNKKFKTLSTFLYFKFIVLLLHLKIFKTAVALTAKS